MKYDTFNVKLDESSEKTHIILQYPVTYIHTSIKIDEESLKTLDKHINEIEPPNILLKSHRFLENDKDD